MNIRTEIREEALTEKSERLWKLVNATSSDFLSLHAYVNRSAGSDTPDGKELYTNQGIKELNKIKEAIKRYDNGLPQEYEEAESIIE